MDICKTQTIRALSTSRLIVACSQCSDERLALADRVAAFIANSKRDVVRLPQIESENDRVLSSIFDLLTVGKTVVAQTDIPPERAALLPNVALIVGARRNHRKLRQIIDLYCIESIPFEPDDIICLRTYDMLAVNLSVEDVPGAIVLPFPARMTAGAANG